VSLKLTLDFLLWFWATCRRLCPHCVRTRSPTRGTNARRDLLAASEPFAATPAMDDPHLGIMSPAPSALPLADLLFEASDLLPPAELCRLPSASLAGFGGAPAGLQAQPLFPPPFGAAAFKGGMEQLLLAPLAPLPSLLPFPHQTQPQPQEQHQHHLQQPLPPQAAPNPFLIFPAAPPLDFGASAVMLRQGRMHGSDGSATGAETPLPAQHQAEMDTLFTGVSFPDFTQVSLQSEWQCELRNCHCKLMQSWFAYSLSSILCHPHCYALICKMQSVCCAAGSASGRPIAGGRAKARRGR